MAASVPPKFGAGVMRPVLLSRPSSDQQSSCSTKEQPITATGQEGWWWRVGERTVLMNSYPASLRPSATKASAVVASTSADTEPWKWFHAATTAGQQRVSQGQPGKLAGAG